MLRSRLYFGMMPVAGLLIAVLLYSVVDYKVLTNRLVELQTRHYAAITRIDRVLLASSQSERALGLTESDPELARSIGARSQGVLNEWLDYQSAAKEQSDAFRENELAQLIGNLVGALAAQFESNIDPPNQESFQLLLERIEDVAVNSISVRNEAIQVINRRIQTQAKRYFFIVIGGVIGSLILMLAVAYSLSQRILTPIDLLTRSAEKLADDEWETDFQPTSRDEISKLEIAFCSMAQRIQEYKRETNLRIAHTRRRMEACFNNLPHPVVFINSERDMVYRNPPAAELLGQQPWDEALPKTLVARIESVFGTGEDVFSTDFDETVSLKLGNDLQHYLPIIIRIDGSNTNEIECALILQDVTNLRLSDELKSDLVATISHEIKTPVTSATMALHILLEESLGALNPDQADLIKTANNEMNRLRSLLEHMLQIARLEKHIPKLNTKLCSPATLGESALESHRNLAESQSVSIGAEIEANLPNALVDPKMIEVALSNFISNAIKYGGKDTHVAIRIRQTDNGTIRFSVLDQGPGIPDDQTDRVFDKFYRSPRTQSAEGIGLGLSICKDIILAHGGEVGCRNRSATGTEFYFDLPLPQNG